MTSKVEFVIEADGTIKRRDISETAIQIHQSAIDALCESQGFKVRNFGELPRIGKVSLTCTRNQTMIAVALSHLRLRSNFKLATVSRAKVLTPSFGQTNDPALDLNWPVPDTLRLRFVSNIMPDGKRYYSGKSWLIAYDANGNAYVLPLGNLYDDASVCMGDYDYYGGSMIEAMERAFNQFNNSAWNSDLFTTIRSEYAQQLFKFKPESFEPILITTDWTRHCQKISTPITSLVCL